jgi:glycosyltransferase involved in cell wall biosynthesis
VLNGNIVNVCGDRMNIVLLTNILNPYRKAFYDELYRQCEEKGHQFHVLVMSPREYNREWKYDDYKGNYTVLLKCRAYRIKHLPVYHNPDLKKRLKELSPDMVVMAGGYMLPSVWKACKYRKRLHYRIYFWSESHLDEKREYSSCLLKIREKIRENFYKKFDGFWYPGEKALQLIQRYARADVACYKIPNLIDNDKFLSGVEKGRLSETVIREKYHLSTDKKIFFAPMRLNWVKGLIPFLEIIKEANCKEKIQIVVAGNGELEGEIRKKAEELGIDLRLLGYCEEEKVIELYRAADVFFMSSLSDPSPLSCVEAIWCGLPLFVSEHVGNYPEVVRQGENGYVYSYSDTKRAARELDELVKKNAAWYRRASDISRKIAAEQFEVRGTTERLLEEMLEG